MAQGKFENNKYMPGQLQRGCIFEKQIKGYNFQMRNSEEKKTVWNNIGLV